MKTRNFSVADLSPHNQALVRKQLGALVPPAPTEEAPQKYRNASVVVDGYRFPSQREALRYLALKDAQNRGEISDLKIQPAWRIEHNGVLICDYVADFSYNRKERGYGPREHVLVFVVEDVKSTFTKTKDYRIKKKLLLAFYRIEVQEIA